ncbi:hypothetical protein FHX08_002758 [Rhizobium sp. BK529]|nr:hypothetical protein [Rhizobium sp. BK529]
MSSMVAWAHPMNRIRSVAEKSSLPPKFRIGSRKSIQRNPKQNRHLDSASPTFVMDVNGYRTR